MKRRPNAAGIESALHDARLLVVCGSGGVGKTTTAAALALAAAKLGRNTLVSTIDPARRLATSLGLAKLTGEPSRVAPRLWATRLDAKGTFDDVVRRYAPNASARDRILSNALYREISTHLVGTHDVMAMESLLTLGDAYDLVVLDTPPSGSALAFLDAPRRVSEFLDARVLRVFLKPYFVAGRLVLEPKTAIGRGLLGLVDRAIGLGFLRDLSEFFLAFEGLYDSFRESAGEMERRLRADDTAFALVTAMGATRAVEAKAFAAALRARGFEAPHLVVNRVHPLALDGRLGLRSAAVRTRGAGLSASVQRELTALLARERARGKADRADLRAWRAADVASVTTVPEQDTDVHDLRGLEAIASVVAAGRRAA